MTVNEDRNRAGAGAAGLETALEHLQGAALQLIAAFRVVLDVAEDLIRDGEQPAPEDAPKRSDRVTRIQVS